MRLSKLATRSSFLLHCLDRTSQHPKNDPSPYNMKSIDGTYPNVAAKMRKYELDVMWVMGAVSVLVGTMPF